MQGDRTTCMGVTPQSFLSASMTQHQPCPCSSSLHTWENCFWAQGPGSFSQKPVQKESLANKSNQVRIWKQWLCFSIRFLSREGFFFFLPYQCHMHWIPLFTFSLKKQKQKKQNLMQNPCEDGHLQVRNLGYRFLPSLHLTIIITSKALRTLSQSQDTSKSQFYFDVGFVSGKYFITYPRSSRNLWI